MKGMAKKLLAVMLAASMVFHPCTAAYGADTQMQGESTENAAGIGGPELTVLLL